jgi:hypothetical protein
MKKLPHHAHNPAEIVGTYGETLPIQAIPKIDWQRMAADSWEQFLTQLGTLSAAEVKIVIDTWSKLVDPAALGDLMGELVKVGTGTLKWLSDFFTGYNTNDPKVDFSKLSVIPYKLPTSAYNYILNPSYEYGSWGGNDTQSEDFAKFGKYSGKLVAAGSDVDGGWSNYIDVRGLTELTINVWMKVTSRTAGLFQSWIEYYNSSKVYITDSMIKIGELGAVTDWTQKTLTDSDLPAGACFARVRNVWRDTPTGTGYVDGWQFNVGDQTPAFQDYTVYSYNWMPEKIDTTALTEYSWSSESWTDILTLTFDCEAKMLLFILAHAEIDCWDCKYGYVRLVMDSTEIPASYMSLGRLDGSNSASFFGCYSTNNVLIVEKGSHTLKLQLASYVADKIVAARSRRLTILKGFYQGGAT